MWQDNSWMLHHDNVPSMRKWNHGRETWESVLVLLIYFSTFCKSDIKSTLFNLIIVPLVHIHKRQIFIFFFTFSNALLHPCRSCTFHRGWSRNVQKWFRKTWEPMGITSKGKTCSLNSILCGISPWTFLTHLVYSIFSSHIMIHDYDMWKMLSTLSQVRWDIFGNKKNKL